LKEDPDGVGQIGPLFEKSGELLLRFGCDLDHLPTPFLDFSHFPEGKGGFL
jgi:hypothetical protein